MSGPVAPRLHVDAVCRYGVGPVSFTAEPGTFVAVTGPTVAGKSALVGVIAGFDRPDAGRVLLDDDDVYAMTRARLESRVGWFGAVIPHAGRAQRAVPPLVVGDEPEAPFVIEVEQAANVFAAVAEQRRLDHERLYPLVRTIRHLCDVEGAVVVVATASRPLRAAADQVVEL